MRFGYEVFHPDPRVPADFYVAALRFARPHGSEIVLRVDNVVAEYEHYLTQRWPVADALQRRPWGLTDFRVFDPTGQYLRITSTQ